MTSASAEDKRADDRRIKELRDFQRANPANKKCFDCNEVMPQYIVLDFNTFVCTTCSGIHREFNHRVKSISMSKFTDTEVKNMLKFGGNEAAQKIWRARHDANFRPSGGTDGERTRNFIRLTFIDRKWAYESPRHSVGEEPQRASSSTKASFDKSEFVSSSAKKSTKFDAFGDPQQNSDFGGFGDFSGFGQSKQHNNEFSDFGHFDSPKSTSSQSTSSHSTSGFGDFGGFTVSKPAAAPPLRDEFKSGSFTLAPPPGSSFGSSTTTTTSAPAVSADFLAFSPEKKAPLSADPFGFSDAPPQTATPFDAFGPSSNAAATSKTSSNSPFDAFAAPPTSGSRSASSSFDAFGSPATPAATPTTTSTSFNAFGAPAQPTVPPAFASFPTSGTTGGSFDAFGDSTGQTSFDAFGTPSTQKSVTSGSFDAFGGASTPANEGFGNFTGSSGSRTHSGVSTATPTGSADPFASFSPRTSSGTKSVEPPKQDSSDPFAAFDGIDSAPPAPQSTPAPPNSTASPFDSFPAPAGSGMPVSTPPAPHLPFGHTPTGFQGLGGTGSKTNSFSDQAKTASFGSNPNLGGYGHSHPAQLPNGPFGQLHGQNVHAHPYPPQHPQPVQLQQPSFQQTPHQNGHYQPGQPGLGAQQWPGSFAQSPPCAPHTPQHTLQTVTHQLPSSQSAPATTASSQSGGQADSSGLKDPFAALSLGSFGLSTGSSSGPSSRGNSFMAQSAAPQPVAQVLPLAGVPSSTPGNTNGGSRGNSFDTNKTGIAGFGHHPTNSPMASFSLGQSSSPVTSQNQSSQSPLSSFTFQPQNLPSKQTSFADANAFGAFGVAPPRTASNPPPVPSANPFDMF